MYGGLDLTPTQKALVDRTAEGLFLQKINPDDLTRFLDESSALLSSLQKFTVDTCVEVRGNAEYYWRKFRDYNITVDPRIVVAMSVPSFQPGKYDIALTGLEELGVPEGGTPVFLFDKGIQAGLKVVPIPAMLEFCIRSLELKPLKSLKPEREIMFAGRTFPQGNESWNCVLKWDEDVNPWLQATCLKLCLPSPNRMFAFVV